MQLNVTPSGDIATPLDSPHCERTVRIPTSGGDAIHTRLALQASVAPDASRAKLYRVFWTQLSPADAPRSVYVTHAAPSNIPGDADTLAALTIAPPMDSML